MSDRDGFMAAILAAPVDDLPRLVFADWLEEHGDGERAEFVRVQCELVNVPEEIETSRFITEVEWHSIRPSVRQDLRQRFESTERDHRIGRVYFQAPNPKYDALRRRERELLRSNWDHWTLLPGTGGAWCCTNLDSHHDADRWGLHFARGFVSSITASWYDWTTHADAIRRATPLERVRLTTWRLGYATMDDEHRRAMLAAEWPGIEFELPATNRDVMRGILNVAMYGGVAELIHQG